MGIVTGYICLICLIILLAKFIARKLQLTKLNGLLMKVHKYAAGLFLLVGILHLLLVIKVMDTRDALVTTCKSSSEIRCRDNSLKTWNPNVYCC